MSGDTGGSRRNEDDNISADGPSPADVQRQLQRILASSELKRASRLADFLAYIVEETLEGRQDRIKAYSIGIEVFGRDADFDPQIDPVVRIEAGRLRRELEFYYLTAGRDDPVGIDIPKGGYVPVFHCRARIGRVADADPAVPLGPTAAGASAQGKWRHWRWAAPAAVTVCLFALLWVSNAMNSPPMTRPGGGVAQPAILVLPFADLGGGKDVGLRAAAITEELKARLVRFREVTIIAPDLSRSPEPSAWPTAAYLLDGSVRADETRLRITGRLIDRTTGTVLWSDVYDIDAKAPDFIALEQDVASQLATAVAQPYGVLFRSIEWPRADPVQAQMSDSYKCALQFYEYRKVLGAELHGVVRACLQRTVAANPRNATAWAMLSYAYLDEDRFGFNPIPAPAPIGRAVDAAERAVQLDPTNVRALQAMMTVRFFNREPQAALEFGEQAYRLNPNDTDLLGEYGSRLMQVGQHARGMAMMEEALARNPNTTGLYSGLLALGAYLQGDDARALPLIRRADLQRFPIYHFVATLIYARNGLAQEAAASRRTFLKMRPGFFAQFETELDKRNFNAADRAKITADAVAAGFDMPAARAPVPRTY